MKRIALLLVGGLGIVPLAPLAPSSSLMAETIFEDDFETYEIGVPVVHTKPMRWRVLSGKVSADGSDIGNFRPVGGALNFGIEANTAATIEFGRLNPLEPIHLSFELRQSNVTNGSYRFDVMLYEKETMAGFTIAMSPAPGYFGSSGFALLDGKGTVLATGHEGAALREHDTPQQISIRFEGNSVVVSQDDTEVLHHPIPAALPPFSGLILTSISGEVSWFLDKIRLEAVPEP